MFSCVTNLTIPNKYLSASRQVQNWLEALPVPEQEIYQRFVLPVVNPWAIEGLDKKKEVTRQQQEARKLETAAICAYCIVAPYSAADTQSHLEQLNRFRFLHRPLEYLASLEKRWEQTIGT